MKFNVNLPYFIKKVIIDTNSGKILIVNTTKKEKCPDKNTSQ